MHALLFTLVALVTPPPTPPPLGIPATPAPSSTSTPAGIATPTSASTPNVAPSTAAPALIVSPAAVNLNPAQQQVIAVTGATAPLTATLAGKLVTVTVDAGGASVTVTATQATGTDTLHLVDATGAQADVPIRVAFNAGTVVAQTTLQVTGNPVDPNWLAQQVRALVARLTLAQPGAQVTIAAPTPLPSPFPTGAQTTFVVPVNIAGGSQFFDTRGTTTVDVSNVAEPPLLPAVLFYDDDPEHVTQDGVLFRGTITATQPSRLYYYHDNYGDPRRLVVALSSQSQDPTTVQTIDATAGPNIDVMGVGHAVSRNFLLDAARGQGTIVDLSGDEPYLLHDIAMGARQGVAGNIDLRVLSGGPVTVTVLAVSPGVDPATLLGQAPLPDDTHHRTGAFALAGYGQNTLQYTVGGADAMVQIGSGTPPSAGPAQSGHDYGAYGVTQTLTLQLSNPTALPATVYLYERPMGGPVRSSFLVDGSLVELGCARVSNPYQIAAFPLTPGQTLTSTVQMMTDGGSFYPLEVGLSGTPPQPVTPPVSAPDGCFPKSAGP